MKYGLRNTFLFSLMLITVGLITYLIYSSDQANQKLIAKDQKIFRDSLVMTAKMKELSDLKLAYLEVLKEKDEVVRIKDSLCLMVDDLNKMIYLVQQKDSLNDRNFAQLNKLITTAKGNLTKVKHPAPVKKEVKEEPQKTLPESAPNTAGSSSDVSVGQHVEINDFKLEPLNKKGKLISVEHCDHRELSNILISFTIPSYENRAQIEKFLTFKLIEPDGKPYKINPEHDFVVSPNNKKIKQMENSISADDSKTKISILYPKNSPYKVGLNTIQVFSNNTFLAEQSIIIQ